MAYRGLNNFNAMDTTRHLSVGELQRMRAQGINTVFRYLAGGGSWKQLNAQDIENFREAGMNLALIYQERGRQAGDFTRAEAREAARETIRRARELGLPEGATVYFAVDYDASRRDLSNNIIPYFQELQAELRRQGSNIQIGVYGSGLVCQSVRDAGLAQRTWLAGASGWRGSQEFFRSGRWDVVQQIRGDRDYNTINPLTRGIGSVNFEEGTRRTYAEAMGPGAETVDPATAARNLQAWLANGNTGDPEHDETRDEFYRRSERFLGMDQGEVQQALERGGPLAVILLFFMFLLVGAEKMSEIGGHGRSTDDSGRVLPNTPPPPETFPYFSSDDQPTVMTRSRMPDIDRTLGLNERGLGIISALVAQGVQVDLAGPNGAATPDGRFDQNDVAAMAGALLQIHNVTVSADEPTAVLNAYQQHFAHRQPTPTPAPTR